MDKNKEPNKSVIALIMGITIGLIIGVGSTYIFMKHQEKEKIKEYEKEKLSITEKLSLEINKLGIRNTVFVYVDKIQRKIEEINSKESTEEEKVKKITKGMYAIDENGVYNEVDDETKEKGYNIIAGKLTFEFSKIFCEFSWNFVDFCFRFYFLIPFYFLFRPVFSLLGAGNNKNKLYITVFSF